MPLPRRHKVGRRIGYSIPPMMLNAYVFPVQRFILRYINDSNNSKTCIVPEVHRMISRGQNKPSLRSQRPHQMPLGKACQCLPRGICQNGPKCRSLAIVRNNRSHIAVGSGSMGVGAMFCVALKDLLMEVRLSVRYQIAKRYSYPPQQAVSCH